MTYVPLNRQSMYVSSWYFKKNCVVSTGHREHNHKTLQPQVLQYRPSWSHHADPGLHHCSFSSHHLLITQCKNHKTVISANTVWHTCWHTDVITLLSLSLLCCHCHLSFFSGSKSRGPDPAWVTGVFSQLVWGAPSPPSHHSRRGAHQVPWRQGRRSSVWGLNKDIMPMSVGSIIILCDSGTGRREELCQKQT